MSSSTKSHKGRQASTRSNGSQRRESVSNGLTTTRPTAVRSSSAVSATSHVSRSPSVSGSSASGLSDDSCLASHKFKKEVLDRMKKTERYWARRANRKGSATSSVFAELAKANASSDLSRDAVETDLQIIKEQIEVYHRKMLRLCPMKSDGVPPSHSQYAQVIHRVLHDAREEAKIARMQHVGASDRQHDIQALEVADLVWRLVPKFQKDLLAIEKALNRIKANENDASLEDSQALLVKIRGHVRDLESRKDILLALKRGY